MKEIRFRIYDTKRKEWVHGPGDEINLFGETIIAGEILRRPDDTTVSLDDLNDLVALQYTGLKDKNGKEIYESDLLLIRFKTDYDLEAIYEVVHRGFTTEFVMKKLIKPDMVISDIRLDAGRDFEWYVGDRLEIRGSSNDYNNRQSSTDIEVIGNIYENPELLKQ